MGKSSRESIVLLAVVVLVGPLLWALHFTALYLIHTLVCVSLARDAPTLVPVIIAVATALAAAPVLLFLFWPRLLRRYHGRYQGKVGPFLRATLGLLLILSLVAIAWGGMSALVVPACT
jgi:hypothetical protein